MKNPIIRLTNYLNNATAAEKIVIHSIISNPENIIDKDIHKLSEECYVSAATIVRLAKKNGFKGYKDLKKSIIQELASAEKFGDLAIENLKLEENDLKEITYKIVNNSINSIKDLYKLVDEDMLYQTIAKIVNANNIFLFGIGASYLVCRDFQQKLERVNKRTSLYEDVHMQHILSNNVTPNDLAIIISYSGLTQEIVEIAKRIKNNGGFIISITKYGPSKLANLSNINLFVPKIEKSIRFSASTSRTTQLILIDIIYHLYLKENYEGGMYKIISTKEILKKD